MDHLQAVYHEHYVRSQEAARGFDDDLDFCPSLTVNELSEMVRESALARQRDQELWLKLNQPASPMSHQRPSASKAIAIIDPTSNTPVTLPGHDAAGMAAWSPTLSSFKAATRQGSISSISSSTSSSTGSHGSIGPCPASDLTQHDLYYREEVADWTLPQELHPMLHWQQDHRQQQFMHDPLVAAHAFSPQARFSSRVPIVNPDNGSLVPLPDTPTTLAGWQHVVSVR
ncbi:hypothetical protein B0O80DRAFT_496314 [Mortierella sp. GBAus27b]|nr:hypothetical protein BGX31_009448 [Mortierella sp. GBA43]KAI8357558.1 hypothetical protein B0O80DRAFT_496314 [Mortierella sp. GBAus27b]